MSFGLAVRNSDGEILVDSTFLNYSLAESGTTNCAIGLTSIRFATIITSLDPPIACAAQWLGKGQIGGITPIGSVGAWTGFSVRVRQANITLKWQAYTTNLPPDEEWSLSVFNDVSDRVFDASRRMLTFSGEVSGKAEDWVRVSGSPFVNGRDDLYHYRKAPIENGQYVAIGVLPFAFFGITNSSRGQVSVVTEVGLGWAASGIPLLFLESFMDAPSGMFLGGIPGAVVYDFPAMPILNI
ncbi:hypothetical protein [Pseudomonas synxantha]|uniref:hypothetical protein n=1 Tax=Pseudomonas synxantha TaxID=47883 RepID=UPI0027934EA2|nr:hypothetical protein [Pseudomonas synxantha]MDQ0979421.1 hypothetical protein [Pseudomonas synxantha]